MNENYIEKIDAEEQQKSEIDLHDFFGLLLSKALWVLLVAALCGGLAFGYTKFLVKPTYQSSAEVYIATENQVGSSSDVTVSNNLARDYQTVATSRAVLEQVIDELGLDVSWSKIAGGVSVTLPEENSRYIIVSVTYGDPAVARDIVDKVCEITDKTMADATGKDRVTTLSGGNLPEAPVSPGTLRNTVLAGVIGVALVVAVLFVMFVLDDKIKTPEQIESILGISILGAIPYQKHRDEKNAGGAKQ